MWEAVLVSLLLLLRELLPLRRLKILGLLLLGGLPLLLLGGLLLLLVLGGTAPPPGNRTLAPTPGALAPTPPATTMEGARCGTVPGPFRRTPRTHLHVFPQGSYTVALATVQALLFHLE